ncbi:MAG: 4Fe-4S binding protein [Bacteroidales bacterium]
MKKITTTLFLLIVVSLIAYNLFAIQRFPKPEFETGYTQPTTQTPLARSIIMEYLDLLVLISTLALASWLAIRKRSRNGIFWLSLFSLVYFGFYRQGCICPVGSIQNVTLALFHAEYQIPLLAIAFFLVPLFFTLLYGRTFCAAVCPLGAIQDIVALRPVSMKAWLQSVLGLIPFIYLGLAILYAATGTDFIICRYDPFVGFFRFNGPFMMLAIGGILLLLGVFIARPYCRFFCPYGVLLNLISRISQRHLTITPSVCIDCKLCEHSCPFGAINKPGSERNIEGRKTTIQRFMRYSLIVPLFIILGAITGWAFHGNLAKVNPTVRLAVELQEQEVSGQTPSMEVTTFRSSGKSTEKLYAEAALLLKQFNTGGWLFGAFIGLVFALTLVRLSVYKHYSGYAPNKGTCFSCARCIDFCPVMPGHFVDGKPVINNQMLNNAPVKSDHP